jgi:hypothetical protein
MFRYSEPRFDIEVECQILFGWSKQEIAFVWDFFNNFFSKLFLFYIWRVYLIWHLNIFEHHLSYSCTDESCVFSSAVGIRDSNYKTDIDWLVQEHARFSIRDWMRISLSRQFLLPSTKQTSNASILCPMLKSPGTSMSNIAEAETAVDLELGWVDSRTCRKKKIRGGCWRLAKEDDVVGDGRRHAQPGKEAVVPCPATARTPACGTQPEYLAMSRGHQARHQAS